MLQKVPKIVSKLNENEITQNNNVLKIQYTENTVNVLKQYIEQVYKAEIGRASCRERVLRLV